MYIRETGYHQEVGCLGEHMNCLEEGRKEELRKI